MKKLLGVFLSLVLGIILFVPTTWAFVLLPESGDVPSGVYCEIKEVKLFAQSAEDCAKAGGVVTHTVTTVVEPAREDKVSLRENGDIDMVL